MTVEATANPMQAAAARAAEIRTLIDRTVGRPSSSAGASFQQHFTAATQATAAPSGLIPAAGTAAVGTLGAASPTPFGAGAPTPFAAEIDAAAARHGVDPALLRALIRAESNFDPTATSPAGAQGLTQLMPGTAAGLGVTNPLDPTQAIEGGAKYLRDQLDRFGNDPRLALAAYNAGPGAVQRYGGVPPYAETQAYVERVLGYAREYGTSASPPPYLAPAASPTPSIL